MIATTSVGPEQRVPTEQTAWEPPITPSDPEAPFDITGDVHALYGL